CDFRLRRAACGGDHCRAEMLAPLYENLAYAAGGCVHEDDVATFHAKRLSEKITRGHAFEQRSGGDVVRNARRQSHRALFAYNMLCLHGADRARQSAAATTDLKMRDAFANRIDHAGALWPKAAG